MICNNNPRANYSSNKKMDTNFVLLWMEVKREASTLHSDIMVKLY
jgi:hypothetical protein